MAKLTWAWPFGYDDFAAPATETTWGFHDVAPITLAIQFDAAAAEWTATYWTPAEVAFNPAAGPSFNITVAVTQAAAGAAGALVESFNLAVAVTQPVATAAGQLRESFNVGVAITQAVTAATGAVIQRFNLAVTATQAPATVAAVVVNVPPGNHLAVAITQPVTSAALAVENIAPPEPPFADRRIRVWGPPLRVRRTLEVQVTQRVAAPQLELRNVPPVAMVVVTTQAVARVAATIAVGVPVEEEDLLLLMR